MVKYEYCDVCQSALCSNYEQRHSREVLRRVANKKLHNSDERNIYEVAGLKASKGHLL